MDRPRSGANSRVLLLRNFSQDRLLLGIRSRALSRRGALAVVVDHRVFRDQSRITAVRGGMVLCLHRFLFRWRLLRSHLWGRDGSRMRERSSRMVLRFCGNRSLRGRNGCSFFKRGSRWGYWYRSGRRRGNLRTLLHWNVLKRNLLRPRGRKSARRGMALLPQASYYDNGGRQRSGQDRHAQE